MVPGGVQNIFSSSSSFPLSSRPAFISARSAPRLGGSPLVLVAGSSAPVLRASLRTSSISERVSRIRSTASVSTSDSAPTCMSVWYLATRSLCGMS